MSLSPFRIIANFSIFALTFFFFLAAATPDFSRVFAQEEQGHTPLFKAPTQPIAIAGDFLVQFKDKTALEPLNQGKKPQWLQKLDPNATVSTLNGPLPIARVQTSNPASSGQWDNLASLLSSDPAIQLVQPNYVRHAFGRINDPLAQHMWFLPPIQAQEAWDHLPQSAPEKSVVVAVIDTGIHLLHDDLRGHVWVNPNETANNGKDDDNNGYIDDMIGWNFYDDNNLPLSALNYAPKAVETEEGYRCGEDKSVQLYETHGTHVAGSIAALHNNAEGVAGMARDVQIMALKALGGPCGHATTYGILQAASYAVLNGADIINMSLGGYGYSKMEDDFFQAVSDFGTLVVAAAGNEGNDNDGTYSSYPASFGAEGIISVAASTPKDQLAAFSNFGASKVDIAAPGVKILSTIPMLVNGADTPASHYEFLAGTSMATPIVSGAAALLKAIYPHYSNIELKNAILNSVDPIPALQGKVLSGGRLNMRAMLSADTTTNQTNHRQQRPTPPATQPNPRLAPNPNAGGPDTGGIRIFDNRTQ